MVSYLLLFWLTIILSILVNNGFYGYLKVTMVLVNNGYLSYFLPLKDYLFCGRTRLRQGDPEMQCYAPQKLSWCPPAVIQYGYPPGVPSVGTSANLSYR